ncbi:hypothetical protein [Enterobacter ludwigii]
MNTSLLMRYSAFKLMLVVTAFRIVQVMSAELNQLKEKPFHESKRKV